MKTNNILRTSAVLGVISAILAAGIFFVDDITRGIIAESESNQLNAYYEKLFQGASFEVIYKVGDADAKEAGIQSIASAEKDGQAIGYLYLVESNGYAGPVAALVGIDASTGKSAGVIVTKQGETPGLGTNATKPGFLDQFKGKATTETLAAKGNITAITGATITSKAVVNDVNMAFADYNASYGK